MTFSKMHMFSSEGFIPHGHCYLWKTELVWLHILSDATIALAYYSIPIALVYFVRKRQDLPFNWIFFLFGAFIIACGTTHVMEIWTLWHPTYWLSGLFKVITAFVSSYTALALIPLVPKAIALPSPAQLEEINKELEREIIERQLVEEALRESEERVRNAFDYAAIGMALVALDGRWLQVNHSLCEIVGYSEQELLSTSFQAITHPDDLEGELNYTNQLLSGEIRYYQFEKRYFHKQGHIVWILLSGSLVRDTMGQPLYFIGQIQDITQRKQAEERLRLLERAIAASNNGIIISDAQAPDRPVIYVNSGFERITGYTKEEVIGKNNRFLQGTDSSQPALEKLRSAIATGTETQVVLRNYRKDGTLFWNEFSITPVLDEMGRLTHFIGVQTDITERNQAEEALRRSEERFRVLVNSAPVGIFQTDLLGDCLFVNLRWLEITELSGEKALGKGWENVLHPDDCEPMFTEWYDAAATGREFARECRFVTPEAKVKWVFVTAVPLRDSSGAISGYLGSAKDISDRKRAEESLRESEAREREKATEIELTLGELKRTQAQLIQAEKMSSLGQMVAGIAHEINNPVGFIYANVTPAAEYAQDLLNLVELYQQHYPNPVSKIAEQLEIVEPDFIKEDFPKLLASIEEGADRITQIVGSLRNFSRLDEARSKQVDIHEGIENALFILQHRLKPQSRRSEIQVMKEYGQLPRVQCYPGELNQVFMNILCNAIDALDEFAVSSQLSGVTEPSTHSGQFTTDFRPTIRIQTDVANGSRVVIRIANNGNGINADVLPKIFDPFFTTKPPGKGKGLGLSICYQIVVDKHGGELTCRSVAGRGTEFAIALPIVQTKNLEAHRGYAIAPYQ